MNKTHHRAPDNSPYALNTSDNFHLLTSEDLECLQGIKQVTVESLTSMQKATAQNHDLTGASFYVCNDGITFGIATERYTIVYYFNDGKYATDDFSHFDYTCPPFGGPATVAMHERQAICYGSKEAVRAFTILGMLEGGDVPISAPYSLAKEYVWLLNNAD